MKKKKKAASFFMENQSKHSNHLCSNEGSNWFFRKGAWGCPSPATPAILPGRTFFSFSETRPTLQSSTSSCTYNMATCNWNQKYSSLKTYSESACTEQYTLSLHQEGSSWPYLESHVSIMGTARGPEQTQGCSEHRDWELHLVPRWYPQGVLDLLAPPLWAIQQCKSQIPLEFYFELFDGVPQTKKGFAIDNHPR